MAYYLWSTATVLHDEWRMFALEFDDHGALWRDVLPPVAERHATPDWLTVESVCPRFDALLSSRASVTSSTMVAAMRNAEEMVGESASWQR